MLKGQVSLFKHGFTKKIHYRNNLLIYLLEITLRKLEYTSAVHVTNRLRQNKDCPHMSFGLILLALASINQKLLSKLLIPKLKRMLSRLLAS